MKKLAIILSLLMIVSFIKAQDNYQKDEIQTIFSKKRGNGGYGAFNIGYSEIDGRDAITAGARGGFIFDHVLAIGIAGQGFINNLDYHSYYHEGNDSYQYTMTGGYGGIFIEPIIEGKSPVHVSFPIILGIGGVSLIDDNYWDWDWDSNHDYYSYDNDVFFVAEPGVELEFNLARFFRLAASASYRFTSKLELYDETAPNNRADPDALQGFNFGLIFKFGKF